MDKKQTEALRIDALKIAASLVDETGQISFRSSHLVSLIEGYNAARQEIASLRAQPYDQRAMGLCHVCGWKGVIDYPDGPVCVACEHDKALSPQPTAQPLHVAATSCPHEIDKDKIVLHFDSKQPGKNALAQLAARLQAAHAQAVPAPGVEAVSEREFKQFLSDVLTAAGLVTHGNKCKDLGRRLGEMSMRLRTAPKTAAAPAQAGEYQPSSADMVMAALDTEEWGLERIQRCDYISDEGNREGAWLVKRQKAPYCACYTDKPGAPYGPRSWSGPTALDALQKAADDLGIRLPQPAARGAALAALKHPAVKPNMLVNGGALKLALNVLRRAGKNEVADELECAAQAAPVDAESWLDLLAEARAALWQPANAALCERLDAFIDAARAAQKDTND